MRDITTHAVEGAVSPTVKAVDERGPGNANHRYHVHFENAAPMRANNYLVEFQNGPVVDGKMNGITNEVLLAIVIDRLEGFQSGPFLCEANATALAFCNGAIEALKERTRDRIARQVEGKLAV